MKEDDCAVEKRLTSFESLLDRHADRLATSAERLSVLTALVESHDKTESEWKEHLMATLEKLSAQIDAQNGRVRKLELWRSYMLGAGAIFLLVFELFRSKII